MARLSVKHAEIMLHLRDYTTCQGNYGTNLVLIEMFRFLTHISVKIFNFLKVGTPGKAVTIAEVVPKHVGIIGDGGENGEKWK